MSKFGVPIHDGTDDPRAEPDRVADAYVGKAAEGKLGIPGPAPAARPFAHDARDITPQNRAPEPADGERRVVRVPVAGLGAERLVGDVLPEAGQVDALPVRQLIESAQLEVGDRARIERIVILPVEGLLYLPDRLEFASPVLSRPEVEVAGAPQRGHEIEGRRPAIVTFPEAADVGIPLADDDPTVVMTPLAEPDRHRGNPVDALPTARVYRFHRNARRNMSFPPGCGTRAGFGQVPAIDASRRDWREGAEDERRGRDKLRGHDLRCVHLSRRCQDRQILRVHHAEGLGHAHGEHYPKAGESGRCPEHGQTRRAGVIFPERRTRTGI